STSSPASVSSWARIAPVHPKPTSTTSTGGKFLAMSLPFPARFLFFAAALSGRIPGRTAHEADGLDVNRRAVVIEKIAIVVAGAGEAHELPANHVAVAAIDRIGEET